MSVKDAASHVLRDASWEAPSAKADREPEESAMHHLRVALWTIGLLVAALGATARGDFTFGWIEYSLEWATDAASAIVSGEVTDCDERGRFELRVNAALKENASLDLRVGQNLQGPCLGRSVNHEHPGGGVYYGPLAVVKSGLGMPVYSEPSTHPRSGCAFPPHPLPVLRRMQNWGQGDRVVLFFGPDVGQIIQIINLDRPLGADRVGTVPYLAVDLHGKPISDPQDILRRIEARVGEGRKSTPDGAPKVCSHGFYHPRSELNGDNYYYTFVPPDPCFRDLCERALGPELVYYATHGGELGVPVPPADVLEKVGTRELGGLREAGRVGSASLMQMAIWYWFYSDRTPQQRAADRQRDFDRALRSFRGRYARQPGQKRGVRLHCRNYPDGWRCAISDDGRCFAYSDSTHVYLYDLSIERPQAARPRHRAGSVDSQTSHITFSPGSDYFAYSERDGGVVLCDLPAGRVLWRARIPLGDARPLVSQQLCFNPDAKYLVQLVGSGRKGGQGFICAWDVETGRRAFAPYDQWQWRLRILGFHKQDTHLIRIPNPAQPDSSPAHQIWDMQTGRVVDQMRFWAPDWEMPPR